MLEHLVFYFSVFYCLVKLFFVEPLRLNVGKEYNLNNIKEIKVTQDFLGLSKTIRRCQNDESQDECKSRKYVDTLMNSCKCLPFAIRDIEKVYLPSTYFIFHDSFQGSLSYSRTTSVCE